MKAVHLLLLITLCSLVLSSDIVDFTYVQYIHGDSKGRSSEPSIQLQPNYNRFSEYEFPQVCSVHHLLKDTFGTPSNVPSVEAEEHFKVLKSKLIDLLKLSEQIKRSKANIAGTPVADIELSNHQSKVIDIGSFGGEISQLVEHQSKLNKWNNEIQQLTVKLERLIKNRKVGEQTGEFTLTAVTFEIEYLQKKLEYLRVLKSMADSTYKEDKDSEYETNFRYMDNKFQNESRLLNEITQTMKSYTDTGDLKIQIANTESQIKAYEIYVKQTTGCFIEREKLKNTLKNDQNISKLMLNLKLKKQEQGNIKSEYCQGVVIKLTHQIKKVIKAYNYLFECSEGKEDYEQKLAKLKLKLQRLKNQTHNNQTMLKDLISQYRDNRQRIATKYELIRQFQINSYSHNPAEIQKIIQTTQKLLYQAQARKQRLPTIPQQERQDNSEINALMEKIKELKSNYCKQDQRYSSKATTVWKKVYTSEQENKFSHKMRQLLASETNKLKDLETGFHRLRHNIKQLMIR